MYVHTYIRNERKGKTSPRPRGYAHIHQDPRSKKREKGRLDSGEDGFFEISGFLRSSKVR